MAIQSCTSCRSYLTSRPYLRQAGPLLILGSRLVAQCLGSHLENRGDLPLGEKGLHVLAFPTSPRAVGLVMRSDETTRSGCVFSQAMSRYVPRQGSPAWSWTRRFVVDTL